MALFVSRTIKNQDFFGRKSLVEIQNRVPDIDEVVGDTFGVLRQREVFGTDSGAAGAVVQAADVVALHLVGQVINLIFNDIRPF